MAHITSRILYKTARKNLATFECGEVSVLHRAGHSNREIAKRLGRVHQTIDSGLKRGTTALLKTARENYSAYFPETGQAVYEKNRKNCGVKSKLLISMGFIDYACNLILDKD